MRSWWSRLTAIFSRHRLEHDLDEEIRAHIDLLAAEYERQGMAPQNARHRARRAFGGVEQMKEIYRDRRTWRWLEDIAHDSRYAIRTLWKNPGFTVVALLTLALGIGANTALFSVIDAVILRKLPVTRPDDLVLFASNDGRGPANTYFSYPLYEDFRDHATTLSGTAVFADITRRPFTVSHEADASPVELVKASPVSGNFFAVLGVTPTLGRVLIESDDRPDAAAAAVVLGHDFWMKRFGGNPAVIGQTVTMSKVPMTIVGVAPPGFFGADVGATPDLWWPIRLMARLDLDRGGNLAERNMQWVRIVGRLRTDASLASAQAELRVLLDRDMADQFERLRRRRSGNITQAERDAFRRTLTLKSGATGDTSLRQQYTQPLVVLMIVVAVVLLIACANVANLLMARAASRHAEIAVRMAIGAGRSRLVRQLLTESVLLAVGGASLGLVAAVGIERVLLSFVPNSDIALRTGLDTRVLVFTALIAIATGLVFGIVPAVFATKDRAVSGMTERGPRTGSWGRQVMQHGLLASQVALSVIVLVAAGLFLRTLQNLERIDLGFTTEGLTVFNLGTPSGYDQARRASLANAIIERLKMRADVEAASLSIFGLLSNAGRATNVVIPGRTSRDENTRTLSSFVSSGYFATTGTRLLAGRGFRDDDGASSPRVAVIDRTMAERFFAGNAVGQQFMLQAPSKLEGPFEVIGVAENAKYRTLREEPIPMFYVAIAQETNIPLLFPWHMEVRSTGQPLSEEVVRQIVRELDPGAIVSDLQSMSTVVDRTLSQERLLATLAAMFGALALIVAAIGVYGVRSFAVTSRTNEIGIRMALGASRGGILARVLSQGVAVSGIGLLIGIVLTFPLTRYVASLLFQVSERDMTTLLGVAVVLGLVVTLASYVPARRATRVDPLTALRYE